MGWWITLGVLVLLAVLPLGASVRYNGDGPLVRVILGPIKFTVFPLKKKEKKEKTKKEPQKELAQPQQKLPQNQIEQR